MSGVVTARIDPETIGMVDIAAGARGMTRSQWIAAVIDRALVGDGHLTAAQADARRAARAESSVRYNRRHHAAG